MDFSNLLPNMAASAGGGLISSLFNIGQARRAWKRYTDYNDPSAQMARLKKAGINPAMAYAKGSMQNTAQQEKVPQMQFDTGTPLQYMSMYQDVRVKRQQKENMVEQKKQIAADTALKNMTKANIAANKAYTDVQRKQFERLADTNYQIAQYNSDALAYSARINAKKLRNLGMDIKLKKEELKYKGAPWIVRMFGDEGQKLITSMLYKFMNSNVPKEVKKAIDNSIMSKDPEKVEKAVDELYEWHFGNKRRKNSPIQSIDSLSPAEIWWPD